MFRKLRHGDRATGGPRAFPAILSVIFALLLAVASLPAFARTEEAPPPSLASLQGFDGLEIAAALPNVYLTYERSRISLVASERPWAAAITEYGYSVPPRPSGEPDLVVSIYSLKPGIAPGDALASLFVEWRIRIVVVVTSVDASGAGTLKWIQYDGRDAAGTEHNQIAWANASGDWVVSVDGESTAERDGFLQTLTNAMSADKRTPTFPPLPTATAIDVSGTSTAVTSLPDLSPTESWTPSATAPPTPPTASAAATEATAKLNAARSSEMTRSPAFEGTVSVPCESGCLLVDVSVHFVARAEFENPASRDAAWRYLFVVGASDEQSAYRISVDSNGQWELSQGSQSLRSGTIQLDQVLNLKPGAANELILIVEGNDAYFFVNGVFAAAFKVALPPFGASLGVDGSVTDRESEPTPIEVRVTVWT